MKKQIEIPTKAEYCQTLRGCTCDHCEHYNPGFTCEGGELSNYLYLLNFYVLPSLEMGVSSFYGQRYRFKAKAPYSHNCNKIYARITISRLTKQKGTLKKIGEISLLDKIGKAEIMRLLIYAIYIRQTKKGQQNEI